MKRGFLRLLLLVLAYAIVSVIIYMALTNTGLFSVRVESKIKSVSSQIVKSFDNKLSSCKSITETISKDPNINLIFFQTEVGGSRREYINYLSRLRSSVKNMYKIVLINKEGEFLISSDYFDSDFREFRLIEKYLKKKDFTFFGSFDVIYSVMRIYDQRGVERGYVAIGWYKDFFEQSYLDSRNLKFIQDLILINAPDKLTKEFIYENSSLLEKKALITEKIDNYNLKLLFFGYSIGLDAINILTIVLSLVFALVVTIWFIVSLIGDKNSQILEEVKDTFLSEVERNLAKEYGSSSTNIGSIEYNTPYDLRRLPQVESSHEYEAIETDIVPFRGEIAERNVATVSEIFEYLKETLRISKVMFMRRVEDGFVQVVSEGFETEDFAIYFSDKVWQKFLSNHKAVSIKGNIKELYELGDRIKDDLFEIIIFPIIDSFGDVRYLFVVGRKWTENDQGLAAKKEAFSRIKNVIISVQGS